MKVFLIIGRTDRKPTPTNKQQPVKPVRVYVQPRRVQRGGRR